MSANGDKRPWLDLYDDSLPSDIEVESSSGLDMFEAAVGCGGDRPCIHYFDATLSFGHVAEMSDSFAVGLANHGIGRGDRVGLYLQNVPQFVIAMIGLWKLGAIPVAINPMLREKELKVILDDSGAKGLVTLESLYRDVAAKVVDATNVRMAVTTSELEFISDPPKSLFEEVKKRKPGGTLDLMALVNEHLGRGPGPISLDPDDVAVLCYTSGTTGPPKGAMNTHRNLVFNAMTYRDWLSLNRNDICLGIAPLFHITGLIGHIAVSFLVPMPLVLGYRFNAAVVGELIECWKPTFTVGAITAFIALANDQEAGRRDISSLRKVCSGGAPIAPAIVEAYEAQFGTYIMPVYGLTETTSPSHMTPLRRRAPVDPKSGALSIGVPIFNTDVKIIGERGEELPPGEVGEIVISGPEVVPGYWQKPEETAHAIPNGQLHTGDVGFMDEAGWFYIVDRRKDQINAAGYKVWPREVEDVLYSHGAVREAAVIGAPDQYRGETVKAFVSLKPGASVTPEELIAFCRQRIAAYKYPRKVEILDELPKTATGKILRRTLRDREWKAQ
jgi:long-chain acyl-CoA synthetase